MKLFLCFSTIVLVGMVLYMNTLDNSFNLDDYFIYGRPELMDLNNFSALRQAEPRRFVPYLSLAANYEWGGLNVFGYHLVNMLIHLARPYYNLGNAPRETGKYEEAVRMYTRSINLAPHFTGALLNRAISYKKLGRYEEALTDIKRLLAKEPQNTKALRQKEIILHEMRQHQIDQWKVDPKNISAEELFHRSNVFIQAQQFTKAIEMLNLYLEKKPNDAEAYNNRGFAKAGTNDVLGALNDYNKALQLDPNLASSYFNRGMIYQRFGQFEDAIKEYDKALSLKPDYLEAYNDRGIAHMKLEKWDEAIADFDKALEINPRFVPAIQNRGLAINRGQLALFPLCGRKKDEIGRCPLFKHMFNRRIYNLFWC